MPQILALQTLDAEPQAVEWGCWSVTWSVYYPDAAPQPVADQAA